MYYNYVASYRISGEMDILFNVHQCCQGISKLESATINFGSLIIKNY